MPGRSTHSVLLPAFGIARSSARKRPPDAGRRAGGTGTNDPIEQKENMKRRFAITLLLGCALPFGFPSVGAAAGPKPPALEFYEDSGRLIARDAFPWGSTLFARGVQLDSRCWRIVWKDPGGAVVRTDLLAGVAATRDIAFTLPAAGPSGAWTAELQQGDQNPGGSNPCSATTSYTTRQVARFDVARVVIMGAIESGGLGGDGGIEEQIPGTVPNGGVGPVLSVRTERNKNKRTFVRFDLSSAGLSGTISAAKLRLFMTGAPADSRTYEIRRVTAPWLESALTWTGRPAVNTAISDARSTGVTSAQPLYWLVAGDVAGFTSGTFSNYGWEIRDAVEGLSSGGREATFTSTEASSQDKAKWPLLLVDYNQSPVGSAGGPYSATCRTASVGGASAIDPEGDALTYAWTSSNPGVILSPASGTIAAGSGARPIPPATATLSSSVAPAGQSATLTLTIADGHGNSVSSTASVAFNDNILPQITAPANLTAGTGDDGPGDCATTVSLGLPQVSDNCTLPGLLVVTNDAPATFPAGPTIVTWTARDEAGNRATATQTVTVSDNENPALSGMPAGVTVGTGPGATTASASASWTAPLASDNCPGVTLTSNHAPGESFALGATTVTYTATDAAGLTTSRSFTVTVQDDTRPVLAVGANLAVPTDPGQCAALLASLATSASDNAPGVTLTGVRSDGAALGNAFAKGVTTIAWTATDAAGNSASATQTVTVNDDESPALGGMPAALTVGTGPGATTPSAVASWTPPLASDNCPGVTLTSDHAPGESFPLGVTTITYTATDAAGHGTSRSFTVTVRDDTRPVLAVGANVTVATDAGQCSAAVQLPGTTASDNAPGVTVAGVRGDGAALGAPFPAGVTPIAWVATDAAGNTASATQTVTVNDLERPVFGPTPGVSVRTDPGLATARVTVPTPAAGDNCPGVTLQASRSDGLLLSQPFPVGVTTITWSATDVGGNRATATQTVTVADRERPVIAVGANLTVPTDAGRCTAVVPALGTTATDNLPGVALAGTRSDGAPLGDPFPAGTTTITWVAADAAGNGASAIQTVRVNDVESPALTGMPAPLVIGTGPNATTANAVAGWTAPVASDNCPGVTLSSNHGPGESFPLGPTTVTYTATDAAGHATSRSFTVTVVDDTPPRIAVANLTVPTDDDACHAQLASLGATASDNVPGVTLVALRGDGALLGDPFPRGATSVAWVATDAAGNTTHSVQTVVVNDTENPAILAPPPVQATTGAGATTASAIVSDLRLGSAFASDNCSGAAITRSGVPAGNRFPVGATEIRYTATDGSGNATTATQLVTVVDDTPPVLARPNDIARGADAGTCEAAVTLTAVASDNCPGVQLAFSPPSGSHFPVGASTVSCTATDAAGNRTETSFTVTVTNPAPLPTITGPATGTLVPAGSPVSLTGSLIDNAGDAHHAQWVLDSFAVPGTVNETLGSVSGAYAFSAAGVYLVQLPVTDLCGGSATADQIGLLDAMIVVYDPSEGFVAGGGRFDSPAGALTSSPSSAGDAGFGFVSKARRSMTAPAGDAEFYFQLGSFRFHASSYEAITIADGAALYRGTGTVNGVGSFGFTLSAVDGQGGDGVDRIRIRITNAGGGVVYDNEPGSDLTAPAATEISAGAIEVQPKRLIASTRAFDAGSESAGNPATALPVAYALNPNFPNPFEGSTGLRFELPQPSAVSLTVYDVTGREVANLGREELPAGRHQRTWNARGGRGGPAPAGVYIVRMDATPLAGGRAFTTRRKMVLLP
jgi:hypothetical protein